MSCRVAVRVSHPKVSREVISPSRSQSAVSASYLSDLGNNPEFNWAVSETTPLDGGDPRTAVPANLEAPKSRLGDTQSDSRVTKP